MSDLERQLHDENERLTKLVDALTLTINAQTATIQNQTETIAEMTAKIDALQEKIQELMERINKDSHNSSKPPSSDGYKKPNPKGQREKSGRKPGGQKGHAGKNISLPHEPDEIKQHFPEKCLRCKNLSSCVKEGLITSCGKSRYVVDVVVTTKVTEHQILQAGNCPMGEKRLTGIFPKDLKAYIQYGDSVSILVGLLNTFGAVSVNRIHVLLGSLMGVSLSTGTVQAMVGRCAAKTGTVLDKIKALFQQAPVGHFDETGIRVGGKLWWVHNSSTEALTYQTVSQRRGKIGIDENGVLPDFSGTAMHDCWAPYWHYKDIRHAVCNAHLLRELTAITENHPDHMWAGMFKTLLRSMKKARDKAKSQGKTKLSYYYLQRFSKEFDRIIEVAKRECPYLPDPQKKKRGRKKKGKERALLERLEDLKDSVCLFIHDFNVPFDNNQAERDLRPVKIKSKVSGCFRTPKGAQDYLKIMSFFGTGKKHGVNEVDSLTAAFAGDAEIILQ